MLQSQLVQRRRDFYTNFVSGSGSVPSFRQLPPSDCRWTDQAPWMDLERVCDIRTVSDEKHTIHRLALDYKWHAGQNIGREILGFRKRKHSQAIGCN